MVFQNLIQGSAFSDDRGVINFFNSFNMSEIVRMYEISPSNITIKRGWQGHKAEKKWFYCHTGSFVVNLIKLDNFESPSDHLKPKNLILNGDDPRVLEISGGYATAFKAIEESSKLLVFSNFSLEESKNDDFRYPIEKWEAKW